MNFGTILRHKLPIIHPDLPIATRDLNSSVQPEFLNPNFLYRDMLVLIGEFRPGNKTIWAVFHEESDFLALRTYFLSPERVF